MRISLWMPDRDPEILTTDDATFTDEQTLEAVSPDGDWQYTVKLIDADSFSDQSAMLTSPARAFFTASYRREIPEGVDPASLMRGEAGWLRIFSYADEIFVDFLRVA